MTMGGFGGGGGRGGGGGAAAGGGGRRMSAGGGDGLSMTINSSKSVTDLDERAAVIDADL